MLISKRYVINQNIIISKNLVVEIYTCFDTLLNQAVSNKTAKNMLSILIYTPDHNSVILNSIDEIDKCINDSATISNFNLNYSVSGNGIYSGMLELECILTKASTIITCRYSNIDQESNALDVHNKAISEVKDILSSHAA